MSKKIRIHSHPALEERLVESDLFATIDSHRIVDRELFDAIVEKYGDHFDPGNRCCDGCGCVLSEGLCSGCIDFLYR